MWGIPLIRYKKMNFQSCFRTRRIRRFGAGASASLRLGASPTQFTNTFRACLLAWSLLGLQTRARFRAQTKNETRQKQKQKRKVTKKKNSMQFGEESCRNMSQPGKRPQTQRARMRAQLKVCALFRALGLLFPPLTVKFADGESLRPVLPATGFWSSVCSMAVELFMHTLFLVKHMLVVHL